MWKSFWNKFFDIYTINRRSSRSEWLIMLIMSSIFPFAFIPASIRRLHDMNRSALWIFILLMPFWFFLAALMVSMMDTNALDLLMKNFRFPELHCVGMFCFTTSFLTFCWMLFSKSAPENKWGLPEEDNSKSAFFA